MSPRPVRVRMAPSPTGLIHLGNVRTALYNLLFARAHGGSYALRIDDTDLERNRPEYEAAIYDSFHWLGLSWDEGPDVGGSFGPYRQSERLDIYRDHAARLIESGAAYRCFCTLSELAGERAEAEREKRAYMYSRRCLTTPPTGRRDFTVRFKVPARTVAFVDLIRGQVSFDARLIGDFVLMKTNAYPTYNFASPVDDALMEITHVLRAEEHLPNTPGQLLILEALGYPAPEAFAHLPWILTKDRQKLSKRKHPESRLDFLREQGYLPEALVNYLALLGWNPGTEQEIFSLDELERAFDLARVHKAGAVFDFDKLDWIDGHYIRSLDDAELARRLQPFLPELPVGTVSAAVPALKERMTRLSDARALLGYLWAEPAIPELGEADREAVAAAVTALATTDWTPAAIEAALEGLLASRGWSKKQLYNPLRIVLTGGNSPPIQHTLALLPRATALARLGRVLA